jgi:POT family proton-dependent oligopeptide transporter
MVDTPTANNRASPDISHENPAKGDLVRPSAPAGAAVHHRDAMERFGYYGMRALLTLYLTSISCSATRPRPASTAASPRWFI